MWHRPLHLGVVAIEKGAFGSPSTMVANFTYICSYLFWSVFNWNHFEMRLLNLRISFLFIADFLSASWYKTQHSYPRSRLITWRRPEVKFGRNVVKKKQHKNYQDEDKKSAINKKLILYFDLFISIYINFFISIYISPVLLFYSYNSNYKIPN